MIDRYPSGREAGMTEWQTQWQAAAEWWLEAQGEWWATVMRAVDAGAPAGAAQDLQATSSRAWLEAVRQIADAQAEVLRAALPDQPRAEVDAVVRHWTDAQRDMLLALMSPTHGEGPDPLGSSEMLASLTGAAERLVHSQAEWARAWTAAHEPPKG
jgi:hypothetical protein